LKVAIEIKRPAIRKMIERFCAQQMAGGFGLRRMETGHGSSEGRISANSLSWAERILPSSPPYPLRQHTRLAAGKQLLDFSRDKSGVALARWW
jgi:hypothetical protein